MTVSSDDGEPFQMRTLVLAILLSSLALGDLEQKTENYVHLSEAVADSLVTYRVQPICPDDACTRCADAEVVLKVVVKRSGTVKQMTVVRAADSRLLEAALDAVKRWRYQRYILNGSPVEYETHATIKSWKCGT